MLKCSLSCFSTINLDPKERPYLTSTSLAPLPLISFSSSFPLSPPRVLLGLLLFAPCHHCSIGGLAEPVKGPVRKSLACFGGGGGGGVTSGLLAAVGLVVEVAEEDDEGDGIADEGVVHPVGEVAVDVEGQGCVANGDVELDLRHKERNRITLLQCVIVSHIFQNGFQPEIGFYQ